MISLTEENYLKAIFHLRNDYNTVTVNELSKFLNVKMPSVNNMMKKFALKNWVLYETYKPLKITEEGKKQAALIVRKHRLTEMFLVEKMNIGWENVHEIAEQLEHVHSELFFDKMDEILQYPKFDPHGEPIPDKEGNIIALDLQKLSNCKIGDQIIFSAVTVSDDDFLTYLNSKELELGTKLEILEIENYDQSMTILKDDGIRTTLSKMVCEKILVKK
ncbi:MULTISPECIES: metal-dependent transcriptional regulator [unclassified Kaistella]|uniref:metal-dependent transcriptional regulator n=1 Tax=unclassified Kaistella TaxID=2762626 RepID=UPI002735508D|nr:MULTISPECIES: metal-dependent transcriptional regulator [unclassified Kaistella]MDP2455010.1 metal-dependent transcriptional regulator [Kaistella sp. SH11-4b]MDP2456007.1 metal-dependent transcriptional regulator [Kaistella sp. SH40-3]MDP2460680.1 metal-dependent transcriptional regulator [Kaistella sp. SH19-2b]